MENKCLAIDNENISKAPDHDLENSESHSCSVCSEKNQAAMIAGDGCNN